MTVLAMSNRLFVVVALLVALAHSKRIQLPPGFASILNPSNSSAPNGTQTLTGEKHRIIGGVETERNEFAFIVSLSRQNNHFCGGAIIDTEWVLTAAHCAIEPDFIVTAGEHDLYKQEGPEQVTRASVVIRHPTYNPVTFEDDICLVKVTPAFRYDTFVKPFSVPPTHYVADGNVTVAGWGTEDEVYQVVSPVLRKVTVPLVPAMECNKQYGQHYHPHKMLCAGEQEGGKDACQGDSGGPLMCDDYHQGATLCGVVSFGYGCARPELAGVYTKVAHYSDWIRYEKDKNQGPNPPRQNTTPFNRRPDATPPPQPALPAIPQSPGGIPPGYVVIIKPANSTIVHRNPNEKRSSASSISTTRHYLQIISCILFIVHYLA